MPKDTPECYNSELAIEEWQCEGTTAPIYINKEFIGYKNLCDTCRGNKENLFEYPCQDKFCAGNQTIKLKGSQVSGNRRNLQEKPDWVFPPLRCQACRDWLANVGQQKKECEACGRKFVIPAGRLKQVKKYEGDPATHGPKFCRSCEELTEEERQNLQKERLGRKESKKDGLQRFKKKDNLKKRRAKDKPKVPPNEELMARMCEIPLEVAHQILEPQPMSARSDPEDIAHYLIEMTGESPKEIATFRHGQDEVVKWQDLKPSWKNRELVMVTRAFHLQKHQMEFESMPANLESILSIADEVMTCGDEDRIATLTEIGRHGEQKIVKVDLVSGHMVVCKADSGHYLSTRPIIEGNSANEPRDVIAQIKHKIGSQWII